MKISVIIPVYNRAKLVRKAVETALNQTYPPVEVIVVDDGSTDGSVEHLKWKVGSGKWEEKNNQQNFSLCTSPFPLLEIISNKKNKGVAAARNLGIRKANGEWLAFLDSDDWWLPTKLQAQVSFHRQNGNCLISQTDEIWIRNGVRVNPKKYHLKPEGDIFELSLSRCLISPSAVLLHRSLLDEVGLFYENLPVCEDYDLWLRIACSHKVGLVKEKLVVKTGGHSDQLSQKYWGMDRFRVKSLQKLLKKDCLSSEQEIAVRQKLDEKLVILKNGAKKRGRRYLSGQAELARGYKEMGTLLKPKEPRTVRG